MVPMDRSTLRPAAFLDRDGVINRERGYVHRPADFELLPGVTEGMARLRAAGYLLVVVTNQAGIARGLYDAAAFEQLTQYMRDLLQAAGVTVDAVYHCPHHPTAGVGAYRVECVCRKPAPGMLLAAAQQLGIDLPASVLVGDKSSDIEAGRRAGVSRCVLVTSGHATEEADRAVADVCVAGLSEAVDWILRPTPAEQHSR